MGLCKDAVVSGGPLTQPVQLISWVTLRNSDVHELFGNRIQYGENHRNVWTGTVSGVYLFQSVYLLFNFIIVVYKYTDCLKVWVDGHGWRPATYFQVIQPLLEPVQHGRHTLWLIDSQEKL